MGLPQTKRDQQFTYADYKSWPDDERWELIDGVAYNMCAAPNRFHQQSTGEVFSQIKAFLKGKPCRVFISPFDVLLPSAQEEDDEVNTVVQPDVLVYCDRNKLTYAGSRGAPDLAVEVISPWTSKKDLNEKFRLYERHGVREYWVFDPASKSVQAYNLVPAPEADKPPRYGDAQVFVGGGVLASTVLEGFSVEIASLFEDD